MSSRVTPEWLEVWLLFLQVHARIVQRLASEMEASEDLPLSWFDVLIQLRHAPDGQLRMKDLSTKLMLTRSGLTRRIDRMEEAGMIRRTDSLDDGRGVVVAITAHGRARLAHVAPAHLERIRTYFRQFLTEQELDGLGSACEAILAGLDTMS
jgi:DNA-binding MarR family transcriptional regulator